MEYDYNVECEQNPYRMDDTVFIWGIKSSDDLSGSPACMYTMNDIDLTYNEQHGYYELGIETIYHFSTHEAEFRYYANLLNKFTEWMNENGHETTGSALYYHPFDGNHAVFDTIPQAYAWFKLMVEHYLNDHGAENYLNNIEGK